MRLTLVWAIVGIFFILWIVGLSLAWGGWLWTFFVIWLVLLIIGAAAVTGRRA